MATQEARELREWRKSKRMTLQKFATFIGVSITSLQDWENGRRVPRESTQDRIAERLGIRPDQIIWPDPKESRLRNQAA